MLGSVSSAAKNRISHSRNIRNVSYQAKFPSQEDKYNSAFVTPLSRGKAAEE